VLTTRSAAVCCALTLGLTLTGCGGGGSGAPANDLHTNGFSTAAFSAPFPTDPSIKGSTLTFSKLKVGLTLYADIAGNVRYTVADFSFPQSIKADAARKLIKQIVSPEFKRSAMSLSFKPVTYDGRDAESFEGGKKGRYIVGRAVTKDNHLYQVLVQSTEKAVAQAHSAFLDGFAITA
jgi:hypothetical protein